MAGTYIDHDSDLYKCSLRPIRLVTLIKIPTLLLVMRHISRMSKVYLIF